jgi:hypothetical protein
MGKAFRLFGSSTFCDWACVWEILESRIFPGLDAYRAAKVINFFQLICDGEAMRGRTSTSKKWRSVLVRSEQRSDDAPLMVRLHSAGREAR